MDFDLSEEQRLLKESVDGLLTDSYDFDARKKYMAEKGGWSKTLWGKLAEQGLLGLPFSEDDGGFGAGAVETMIVMAGLGKALVLEPYLATVVIAGGFLRHGGSAAQKAAYIPGIIDGSNEAMDWTAQIAPSYFNNRKVSIYGGSNEIQRNIITKAVLGL